MPFLALLAAAALVLLTPSPAPANITEGRLGIGAGSSALVVAVFADVADAQDGVPTQGVASSGSITTGDAAYIGNGADPRNTFSGNDLYVSNQRDAYNTVLITATVAGVAEGACAEATVFNKRSRDSITVLLAPTSEASIDGARTYQAVVNVVSRDEEDAPGPACEDYTSGAGASAALRAHDGDTIAITAQGVASSIDLVVDGEGPEVQVFSPLPGSYFRSVVVNFSFDVRDDGAGLRHDGEFETSGDGDPRVVNVDGDQLTSQEPRSTPDGGAADIHAYLSREGGDPIDITPYGSSRWRVLETGAAYALAVDVNLGGSGSFDLAFEVTDRTGNTTVADSADVAVPPPAPTPTPKPAAQPATPTPIPIPTPEPTATPTPTPTPQPTPTPTPEPGPDAAAWLEAWAQAWQAWLEHLLAGFFR
ncbi:MAG: hypothetical protein OXL97_10835 [Chloroflexota bacterium]|nr:hypothetical protein [Chloroflexota bacterium]